MSANREQPLNVNDSDLHPEMTEFPQEREGFTDMTFCLLRFEIANVFRRILYVPPGPNRCTEFFAGLSIADKERWITECHDRLEKKFLTKNIDMSKPLCWVTATVSRLIMSKMWLIVYHPHQRKDGGKLRFPHSSPLAHDMKGATLPQETKDKLFITSLENIEYSMLLETEARTMKWGWLFRTYVQWHAIAFLLSELCVRTKGEAVDRAWRALEATAGRWWFPLHENSPYQKDKQGCLWKPLRKLLAKAKAARDREMALERASLALRNGQYSYCNPEHFDPTTVAPITTDQPNSDTLDQMLRPTAPKLGEVLPKSRPSWPPSPTRTDSRGSRMTASPLSATNGTSTHAISSGQRSSVSSPGQNFNQLSNFGLDSLLTDVMDGMTYDSAEVHKQFAGQQPPIPRAGFPLQCNLFNNPCRRHHCRMLPGTGM